MAGRRMKPCPVCEDIWVTDYIEGRNGFCLWAEYYPMNNFISVICQANDEVGEMQERNIDIEMNYCPSCGRKLIE